MKRAKFAITLLLVSQNLTSVIQGRVNNEICSSYSFESYGNQGNWTDAKNACRNRGSNLVSMETEKEWKHVKGLAKDKSRPRWFIGLTYVSESSEWCWLSDYTSCINNASSRWYTGEPNNFKTEKCVEMYGNGKYNNVACEKEKYVGNPGFICENHENCTEAPKKDMFIWTKTIAIKTTTQPLTTKETSSSKPKVQLTLTREAITTGTTATTTMTSATVISVTEATTTMTSSTGEIGKGAAFKTISVMRELSSSTVSASQAEVTERVKVGTHSSNRESNSSLVMILVIILAVLVGILLVVLAYIIWRKKVFRKEGRESRCGNLDSVEVDVRTVGQNCHDQTQYQRNSDEMVPGDLSSQVEALEMVNMEYNYAVVRKPKKNLPPPSNRMSPTPQQYLSPNDEDITLAASAPLSRPLKEENHVYANVKQGPNRKLKSEASPPSDVTAKKPEEHTDRTDGLQDYLYAVVDKTKKKTAT